MAELGIMLYGYGKEDAVFIKTGLEELLGLGIDLISASGKEDIPVGGILEMEDTVNFSPGEQAILMFLGFDDPAISQAMDGFPSREGLERPIFCAMTESNVKWSLKELMDDLLEERRYWNARKDTG